MGGPASGEGRTPREGRAPRVHERVAAPLPDLWRARPERLVRMGTGIRYWVTGPAWGPVVVGIHGLTLDQGALDAQVPALRDAGYRVVTFDLAGHGMSRAAPERLSVARAAEDVAILLDGLGIGRAALVGQSFGGFVAQEFARRHPERVDALVLAGAWPLGTRPAWRQRVGARVGPRVLRVWPARHLFRTLPRLLSDRPGVRRDVERATAPLSKADVVAFTQAAADGLLGDDEPTVVDVPALFVHGEDDRPWVVELIRAADQHPSASVESFPGAGHLVNQDQPERFNEVMLAFLARHVPAHGSAPRHGRAPMRRDGCAPAAGRVPTVGGCDHV